MTEMHQYEFILLAPIKLTNDEYQKIAMRIAEIAEPMILDIMKKKDQDNVVKLEIIKDKG